MKTIFKLLLAVTLFSFQFTAHSQTAEEIVANYLEMMGGEENMANIKSTISKCSAKAQGMEIPVTMYSKAPGMQRMDMVFQGKTITQFSFDGSEGWTTNFMTMEAEKMDKAESDVMKEQMDFPDPFVGYADKGYSISKEADEEIEGSDCYQIKLTRKPVMVDGKEEVNATYFFFEKESGALIMSRSTSLTGQAKGMTIDTYMSDYEEVDGLYFPMTMTQKMGGQTAFSVTIDEMELNPEVEESMFAFPEKKEEAAPEK